MDDEIMKFYGVILYYSTRLLFLLLESFRRIYFNDGLDHFISPNVEFVMILCSGPQSGRHLFPVAVEFSVVKLFELLGIYSQATMEA